MDLRCVNHLFIGAEPIRVSTVAGFVEKFKPAGITPQTIRPAYGLAESTIISTMTPPDKTSHFICLDPDAIAINEPVRQLQTLNFDDDMPALYDASKSTAMCAAGTPIEGMRVEIVDEEGAPITQEGIAGEIALQGTSVALGYVSGGDSLIDYFADSHVRTGDVGTMINGELYILERIKNIIIRNGENYLVSTLEEQLSELLNISHEHVAVFESNIHNPDSDIVVLVERHKPISDDDVDTLLATMPKEAFPINRILLSRSREIPRTTSGKKRHFYCRKLYQSDGIVHQQAIEVSPQRIVQATNAVQQRNKA